MTTAFLKAGIPVICGKPLATRSADARKLQALAAKTGLLLALTHNYTGHPMVRQARERVQGGALGQLRLVQVEYLQDWLAEPIEQQGQKQAGWRTDPAQAGAGACIGDIGSHAFQLAEHVSAQRVSALGAELCSVVDGRRLDDNAQMLLRFDGGARGGLWAS